MKNIDNDRLNDFVPLSTICNELLKKYKKEIALNEQYKKVIDQFINQETYKQFRSEIKKLKQKIKDLMIMDDLEVANEIRKEVEKEYEIKYNQEIKKLENDNKQLRKNIDRLKNTINHYISTNCDLETNNN